MNSLRAAPLRIASPLDSTQRLEGTPSMFTANPENATVIQKIAELLSAVSVGAVVSYAELSSAVDRQLDGKHRHLLSKAREEAEKNLGCLYECVRGAGIKRLPWNESPEVGLSAIGKARRVAKRGNRRLGRLNVNSLSDGERKRVISYTAMLGAVAMLSDGNKARVIAAIVDPSRPIPPSDILDMFRKK